MTQPKKHILILCSYFFPYVSGVSEYARLLAETLAKSHKVTVLTAQHKKHLPSEETIDGYRICRAKPLMFIDKGYISIDLIIKYIRISRNCDIININFPMLECGLLSLLSNKPMLMTYQCDMAPAGSWLSRLAVRIVQLSGRIALRRAQAVTVLSLDYAHSSPLLAPCRHKLVEVRPPNKFEKIHPVAPHGKDRQQPDEAPIICGFIGRFVEEKGIATILDAASTLSGRNIVFWLAGDYSDIAGGSIFPSLQGQIERLGHQVRLLGKLEEAEMVAFYSSIDLLLLPSINRFEAFGMVQIEAMTFGAMVISSDMPGVRDVVRATGMGALCAPGSVSSLVAAIEKVSLCRKTISRDAVRKAVLRHFANHRFQRSYLDLIGQFCKSQAG
jgi:glycosyltransferase involved in cell wall biosynthesis